MLFWRTLRIVVVFLVSWRAAANGALVLESVKRR